MANRKEVSEFSAKFTSFTFSPGPHGTTILLANLEGSVSGLGIVLGTGAFVLAGGKSGSYTWCGIAYLDNGEQVASNGVGTYGRARSLPIIIPAVVSAEGSPHR
jgi:hypothetical protein